MATTPVFPGRTGAGGGRRLARAPHPAANGRSRLLQAGMQGRSEIDASRVRTLVNYGPRHAKPVAKHAESRREERLLHLHENLPSFGQELVNSLRLRGRVDGEIEIDASHLLKH